MLSSPLLPTTPTAQIPRVTADHAKRLGKLGIVTLEDFLYHFPTRHDDLSHIYHIADLERDTTGTVAGTVRDIRTTRSWKKRMAVTSATLSDTTGTLRLVWFNDRYIGATLKEGAAIRVSGVVSADFDGLLMANPACERATSAPVSTARLVPVYPETAGLTSRWIRWIMSEMLRGAPVLPEIVPTDIRDAVHLPDRATALRAIHFPRTTEQYQVAQKYFAFEEMFLVQLHALRVRQQWHTRRARTFSAAPDDCATIAARLPYTLTGAQQRAVSAIARDLTGDRPMHRLLNGDVGSGKTAVAAIAAYAVAHRGRQVAILAPTEVLARQHYASLRPLFEDADIPCALMTGAVKMRGSTTVTRPTILSHLRDGDIRVVIGTHALVGEDVHFHDLALVVIDEQHRFGVAQRAAMQAKTAAIDDGSTRTVPHFLSMTATPIPRSLALAFFGDVELSVLDEMPANRKPIVTTVVGSLERARTYDFIRAQIAEGRQAYIILPLVETSDKESVAHVKAATEEAAALQKTEFRGLTVGLVHGRMSAKEKDAVMNAFRDGRINVLVATAVVEVGVDVANASVMVIEGAERFGLSQLHQFRGRIGRGIHQSHCFLFASRTVDPPPERLRILAHNTSGFAIAEEDLKLRGPGEFFGTRQSGLPDIAMANITNVRLIEYARTHADALLAADPRLTHHPALRAALSKFEKDVHRE